MKGELKGFRSNIYVEFVKLKPFPKRIEEEFNGACFFDILWNDSEKKLYDEYVESELDDRCNFMIDKFINYSEHREYLYVRSNIENATNRESELRQKTGDEYRSFKFNFDDIRPFRGLIYCFTNRKVDFFERSDFLNNTAQNPPKSGGRVLRSSCEKYLLSNELKVDDYGLKSRIGVFKPVLFVEFVKPEQSKDIPERYRGKCHFDILWNAVRKKPYSRKATNESTNYNNNLLKFLADYPNGKYRFPILPSKEAKMKQDLNRQVMLEEKTGDQYRSYSFEYTHLKECREIISLLNHRHINIFERVDFLNNMNQEPIKSKSNALRASCEKNMLPEKGKTNDYFNK